MHPLVYHLRDWEADLQLQHQLLQWWQLPSTSDCDGKTDPSIPPFTFSPQVVMVELLKLTATVLRSGCRLPVLDSQSVRASLKFLLPSVIYAVNNNIYLAGLTLVPSLYKFILKRDVTSLQFLGCLLIVGSIVCAKLGEQ